jgi:predicted transposase YbfD/YdcC
VIIVESEAEYILPVKENQKTLYNEIETYFNDEIIPMEMEDLIENNMYHKTLEKNHGRIEKRQYYMSKDISCISNSDKWENIKGIGYENQCNPRKK